MVAKFSGTLDGVIAVMYRPDKKWANASVIRDAQVSNECGNRDASARSPRIPTKRKTASASNPVGRGGHAQHQGQRLPEQRGMSNRGQSFRPFIPIHEPNA